MKTHSLIAAIVLIALPAFAEDSASPSPSPSPSELSKLRQGYADSLKHLLDQYVKDNDVVAAAAVSQELEKVQAAAPDTSVNMSPIGRWKWAGGSGTTLTPEGMASNEQNKGVWHWIDESSHKLQVEWKDGTVDKLTVSPDGKAMQGSNNLDVKFVARRLSSGTPASTSRAGAASFAGTTWTSDAGDSTMVFEPSGEWHERWGKTEYHGTWESPSPDAAVVRFDSGKVRHFTMSADSQRIFRLEEPCGWNRIP